MRLKARAIILLGTISSLSASSVYSPSRGVICDRKAGFCTDSYGISLGLTKEYLGSRAEKKWSNILNDNSFDSTSFTLSNGLSCSTKQKICKKSKWDDYADPHWTRVLFGSSTVDRPNNKNSEAIRIVNTDCKNYISEKFNIPRSTIHVSNIKVYSEKLTASIRINSKRPLIEERGICSTIYGDVSYRASYE